MKQVILILAAGLIGFSFGHAEMFWPLIVLSFLLPVIWVQTESRFLSGGLMLVYSLVASRGLLVGASVYFDASLLVGAFWWVSGALLWFTTGFLCWHKNRRVRVALIPVLMLLLIIPPTGLSGWAHPLISASYLFPSFGFFGLSLCLLLMLVSSAFLSRAGEFIALALTLVVASYALKKPDISPPSHFIPHQTSFVFNAGSRNFPQEFQNMKSLQASISKAGKGIHWTPESTGGVWSKTTKSFWVQWAKKHKDKTVLLSVLDPKGGSLNNVIILLSGDEQEVVYRQRFPVPGVNKFPEPETITNYKSEVVAGTKIGFLICYETLMFWPVIQTMLDQPELLLVNGSVGWSPESIWNTQRASAFAFSQLFNVPLVEAWNK